MSSVAFMPASVCFEQSGTVESICDHSVRIRIHRETACGHCHASNICSLFDTSERIVDADGQGLDLKTGDTVQVIISRSMGQKAILLGYLLPFIILVAVLILTQALGLREWLSGLLSLAALIPYFAVLYLLQDRLRRNFQFTIRKTN